MLQVRRQEKKLEVKRICNVCGEESRFAGLMCSDCKHGPAESKQTVLEYDHNKTMDLLYLEQLSDRTEDEDRQLITLQAELDAWLGQAAQELKKYKKFLPKKVKLSSKERKLLRYARD